MRSRIDKNQAWGGSWGSKIALEDSFGWSWVLWGSSGEAFGGQFSKNINNTVVFDGFEGPKMGAGELSVA